MAAQLADLLPRVAHPLHQALLMYPLDRARADARVEQRAVRGRLGSAEPAEVSTGRIRIHHCPQSSLTDVQQSAKVDTLNLHILHEFNAF